MSTLMSTRVLVIDDDEITLSLASYRLQKEGFFVETASDGVTAIEKLKAGAFGAVVLDILMPRLDGFGVLQYISENQPHLRPHVIVMTALANDHTPAIEGTFRTIQKPLDYSELAALVRDCVARTAVDGSADWFDTPHGNGFARERF